MVPAAGTSHVGGGTAEFLGVAAASADCVWAVGFGGGDRGLIAHWDGGTWTRQADRHGSGPCSWPSP